MKDWMLAVGVTLLVCLDLLVLTIYTAVEETSDQTVVKLIRSKEQPPETVQYLFLQYMHAYCN